jgi:type IV pilus assembly protein PilZ
MNQTSAPRQGIISLTIKDKSALYAAYMPFVKGGGLFIPTKKHYLGDEVSCCHADGRAGEGPVAGRVGLHPSVPRATGGQSGGSAAR